MDQKLIDKVKKLLALGRRGGNEAEMESAMRKVYDLVAAHGLSLSEIENSANTEDALALKMYPHLGPRQSWKLLVLDGLATLYFSAAFRNATGHALLLAKPSNAAIIHHLFLYCVGTAERLAKKHPAGGARAAFKAGFSSRLRQRCQQEAVAAASNQKWDSATGKHLILAPLYNRAIKEMNEFFQTQPDHLQPRGQHQVRQNVNEQHYESFAHGHRAANSVSLRPTGIEVQKSVNLLPNKGG